MADEIKVIDLDVGKGAVHLVNEEVIDEMYKLVDKRPLKYMYTSYMTQLTPAYFGIDFAKAPDCTGRVTYWVAPFKYKTAGFDHFTVNSEFGMVWRLLNYPSIDLKDLPINYNFTMAKEFYKNWSDELLSLFKNHFRLFINGLYGKYMYNACNIPSSWYSPSVYQDMLVWLSKRRFYIISARGAGKTRIR